MSFAGTPLGQNRRLDHNSFLGKPPSNQNRPPSPHKNPPTSYAYGAPTLGSRSPPKHTSLSSRERSRASLHDDEDDNQPALARFALHKQREQQAAASNSTNKLDPGKWSVKDTSVNVAAAFSQAVLDTMAPTHLNPNSAWASGSTQSVVPRSTSVDYEESLKHANKRAAPAPPSRRNRDTASNASFSSASGRRPVSKNSSAHLVPDSEPDDEGSSLNIGRAKSPMAVALDAVTHVAKGAVDSLSRIEFRLREPSFNVDGNESFHTAANGSTRDQSYDYAAEEQMYKNMKDGQKEKEKKQSHRRGKISEDNRAYKPSEESEFEDDEFIEEEKRGKRKKKVVKGLSLPSIKEGKKRKRSSRKSGAAAGDGPEAEGEEEEEEDDDDQEGDEHSQSQIDTSIQREPSISRGRSLPSDHSASFDHNTTMGSDTQLLNSIPELDESQEAPMDVDLASGLSANKQAEMKHQKRRRSRSHSRTRTSSSRFSVGGLLGTIVNKLLHLVVEFFTFMSFILGRIVGTIYSVAFDKPAKWVGRPDSRGRKAAKYLVVGGLLLFAWTALRFIAGDVVPGLPGLASPFSSISLPSMSWGSKGKRYTPPETPIENIADLVERLAKIEQALSGLVGDTERAAAKAEDGVKGYRDVLDKIGSLEGKVRSATEVGGEVRGVRHEVEVLQAQIRVREREERDKEREQEAKEKKLEKEREERENEWRKERESIERAMEKSGGKVNVDEEKIRWLESKVGSVESGIREAIEIGRRADASASSAVAVASSASSVASSAAAVATSSSSSSSTPGSAWWSKIGSGISSKTGITIKSADGQDVTELISHMVDDAVALYSYDGLAKPDYALHSGGARVIPHLTSNTMEVRPSSRISAVIGMLTGNGYAIGRPPVTALHHEMHSGHCWPFVGERGQLGVALSMPIIVEEITVDHVAKEVAFDMRSAPREMEVWGLVEGWDNIEKVEKWKEEKWERRKLEAVVPTEDGPVEVDADAAGLDDEIEYPVTLPKNAPYIKIASFTYDINAHRNTQTFPVDPEIKALGVDFGVVALRVLNNWGKEFTCLYRFRVHGTRVGEVPSPTPGLDERIPSDEESS